jgi:putative flippase GtrA
LMQAISAVFNNLIMIALVSGAGLYGPVAKVLQIGIVFVWNFSFCRLVVFTKKDGSSMQ